MARNINLGEISSENKITSKSKVIGFNKSVPKNKNLQKTRPKANIPQQKINTSKNIERNRKNNKEIESKNKPIVSPKPLSRLEKNTSIHQKASEKKTTSKAKPPKKKITKLVASILLISFLFIVGIGIVWGKQQLDNLKKGGVDINLIDVIAPKSDPQLAKVGNLTNILIVGVDTRIKENSGLENSDTIMIVSYNHDLKKVSLISIPRDTNAVFNVGSNKERLVKGSRINSVFLTARDNNFTGGGLTLLRSTIAEMTGLQINYTMQVNFEAFKQAVDKIGGLDIDVENTFCDGDYPKDDDSGVQRIEFYRGQQHMDGATALKYARSRVHGVCTRPAMTTGDPQYEGNDFARARRQQKVISALQEKIKKQNFVTDPAKVSDFISIFGNNIKIQETDNSNSPSRDIQYEDISAAIKLKDVVDFKNLASVVLDPNIGGCNLIIKENIDGQIYPSLGSGKYDQIINFVKIATQNPGLYLENKKDCYGTDTFAKIGVADAGFGNSNVLKEIRAIESDFVTAMQISRITTPIILEKANIEKNIPEKTLFGVGIYAFNSNKPSTKQYLLDKYKSLNPTLLTADQVPDSVKKLKGYDIVVIFTK